MNEHLILIFKILNFKSDKSVQSNFSTCNGEEKNHDMGQKHITLNQVLLTNNRVCNLFTALIVSLFPFVVLWSLEHV